MEGQDGADWAGGRVRRWVLGARRKLLCRWGDPQRPHKTANEDTGMLRVVVAVAHCRREHSADLVADFVASRRPSGRVSIRPPFQSHPVQSNSPFPFSARPADLPRAHEDAHP